VNTLSASSRTKADRVQQLGGAVMIIRLTATFSQRTTAGVSVLWFSVVLNVNLALLNLVPFPCSMGPHHPRQLKPSASGRSAPGYAIIQTACAVLLIFFMLFIAFYDAGDWYRSSAKTGKNRSSSHEARPEVSLSPLQAVPGARFPSA